MTLDRRHFWGARTGHRDELVFRERRTTGAPTLNERLYCLMDYFSPAAIVDLSGTVLERYAFTAFGKRRVLAPDYTDRGTSSYDWDFGFQGQFVDLETRNGSGEQTGLYNYGYRYYVSALGRWPSRDPIEEAGGVNQYVSTNNSLWNKVDRLGLQDMSLFTGQNTTGVNWTQLMLGLTDSLNRGESPTSSIPWNEQTSDELSRTMGNILSNMTDLSQRSVAQAYINQTLPMINDRRNKCCVNGKWVQRKYRYEILNMTRSECLLMQMGGGSTDSMLGTMIRTWGMELLVSAVTTEGIGTVYTAMEVGHHYVEAAEYCDEWVCPDEDED